MSELVAIGKIEVIYEAVQVSEKFKKREFVLEIQAGMYPEYPKFQVTQERCGLLDTYEVGDLVKVSFNLRGRPYEKNGEKTYFTNIEAWRVDLAKAESPSAPNAPDKHWPMAPAPKAKPSPPPLKEVTPIVPDDGLDDLPF